MKPGNVLIAADGRVVLTDFGLATFDDIGNQLTQTGVVHGSPQFIAPERALDGTSSPEADLWSLGATLYAAVEGRAPYSRVSSFATLTALATAPPDPPQHAGAAEAGARRSPAPQPAQPHVGRRGPPAVAADRGRRAGPARLHSPAAQAGRLRQHSSAAGRHLQLGRARDTRHTGGAPDVPSPTSHGSDVATEFGRGRPDLARPERLPRSTAPLPTASPTSGSPANGNPTNGNPGTITPGGLPRRNSRAFTEPPWRTADGTEPPAPADATRSHRAGHRRRRRPVHGIRIRRAGDRRAPTDRHPEPRPGEPRLATRGLGERLAESGLADFGPSAESVLDDFRPRDNGLEHEAMPTNGRSAESRLHKSRLGEGRLASARRGDGRPADTRLPDARFADSRLADGDYDTDVDTDRQMDLAWALDTGDADTRRRTKRDLKGRRGDWADGRHRTRPGSSPSSPCSRSWVPAATPSNVSPSTSSTHAPVEAGGGGGAVAVPDDGDRVTGARAQLEAHQHPVRRGSRAS